MDQEELVNDLKQEIATLKFVNGVLRDKHAKMRAEVAACNKAQEKHKAEIAYAIEKTKTDWQCEQARLLGVMMQLKCDLDDARTRNGWLMASINTLVHEWLTPEQREALQRKDPVIMRQKKDELTLRRKIELGLHSSE